VAKADCEGKEETENQGDSVTDSPVKTLHSTPTQQTNERPKILSSEGSIAVQKVQPRMISIVSAETIAATAAATNPVASAVKVQHPKPAKSPMLVFFDAFFAACFALDPSMELIFSDVKTRADIMSRMIGFLIRNCDKLDDPDVKLFIERIAWAHVRANVQSGHYHTLTMGLLLTFKRVLRNKFTTSHQLAWTTVLSKFFISLFPHLPLKPSVRIKAAGEEPDTSERPLNNVNLCNIEDGVAAAERQRQQERELETDRAFHVNDKSASKHAWKSSKIKPS
jgi:hemoglobin-like flavoprotein